MGVRKALKTASSGLKPDAFGRRAFHPEILDRRLQWRASAHGAGSRSSRSTGHHEGLPGASFATSLRRIVCRSSRISHWRAASRIFAGACRRVIGLLRTTAHRTRSEERTLGSAQNLDAIQVIKIGIDHHVTILGTCWSRQWNIIKIEADRRGVAAARQHVTDMKGPRKRRLAASQSKTNNSVCRSRGHCHL